jgi:hypothetical protein
MWADVDTYQSADATARYAAMNEHAARCIVKAARHFDAHRRSQPHRWARGGTVRRCVRCREVKPHPGPCMRAAPPQLDREAVLMNLRKRIAQHERSNEFASTARVDELQDLEFEIESGRFAAAAPTQAREREGETSAARDVLAERERQKAVEGWTPEHDDGHAHGEIANAAAAYASAGTMSDAERTNGVLEDPPADWPWDWAAWKPKDRRRDLVRAGALILAEIERLDRAASAQRDGGK